MTEITVTAFHQLLIEDVEWLTKQPRSLERDHIFLLLNWLKKRAEADMSKPPIDPEDYLRKVTEGEEGVDGRTFGTTPNEENENA